MKRLNAVLRLTFSLATMFAIVFLSQAESGNKRATVTQQKRSANHEIHIMDQNGNPAVSGRPSGTGQIFDVQVVPGVRCPALSGPYADLDGVAPIWTVPQPASAAERS